MACYYCGRHAGWQCDAFVDGAFCEREVCDEHSIPEYEDGTTRYDFTLCKDHFHLQVKGKRYHCAECKRIAEESCQEP